MRVLYGSLALWALLAVDFAVAQERGTAPATRKKAATPGKPLQFDLDGFLKEHDKNGDGFLQRDEVPLAYRAAFERIDTNKDGKVSREELAQGIALLRPRRRPSDLMYMLVETSDFDEESQREVQRLRNLAQDSTATKMGKLTRTNSRRDANTLPTIASISCSSNWTPTRTDASVEKRPRATSSPTSPRSISTAMASLTARSC